MCPDSLRFGATHDDINAHLNVTAKSSNNMVVRGETSIQFSVS